MVLITPELIEFDMKRRSYLITAFGRTQNLIFLQKLFSSFWDQISGSLRFVWTKSYFWDFAKPDNTNLRGSIAVQMTSCLFSVVSAALLILNEQQFYLFGQIQTSQAWGQQQCDQIWQNFAA